MNTQYELLKLFKPVTDKLKDLKEGLVSELKPIREGMKNLPNVTTFPQFPSITADDDDGEEEVNVFIGDIAGDNCETLLPCLALIRHLDCGIRMVSSTSGTMKQK